MSGEKTSGESCGGRCVRPVRSTHGHISTAPAGIGRPRSAQGQQQGHDQAAGRRVPGDDDLALVAGCVAQPQVGVDRVLHGGGIGVLGGQPVVDDQRGGPRRGGDGAGQVAVAERGSGHVPAAVQVQHGGRGRRLRGDPQRGHPARDDRGDGHVRRRGELPVQFLQGGPDAVEIGHVGRRARPRLPQQGHPAGQLAAYRTGDRDRVVQVGEQRPGPRQQGLAGQRQLDALGGPAEQVAPDQAFQAAYLAAERGLRDEQPLGRPAEAEILGDRDERAQMAQFDRVRRLRQRQHVLRAVHVPSLAHDRPAG